MLYACISYTHHVKNIIPRDDLTRFFGEKAHPKLVHLAGQVIDGC